MSSMSSFSRATKPYTTSASSANVAATARHGGHHYAVKSTIQIIFLSKYLVEFRFCLEFLDYLFLFLYLSDIYLFISSQNLFPAVTIRLASNVISLNKSLSLLGKLLKLEKNYAVREACMVGN